MPLIENFLIPLLFEDISLKKLLLRFIVLIILTAIFLILKKIITTHSKQRQEVIESIRHTLRQAISHQNPNQDLSYALNAHKEQQSSSIEEKAKLLPSFDPFRKNTLNYVKELQSVNSFSKSETLTKEFLNHHKIRY